MDELLDQLADRLLADAEVSRLLAREELKTFLLEIFGQEDRLRDRPALVLRESPSMLGRVVWTLEALSDADELKDSITLGQVWIRYDLIAQTKRLWPVVYAHANQGLKRLGRPGGRRGRPKGSRLADREQSVAALVKPAMPRGEVYRLLIQHGIFDDDGLGYSDAAVHDRNRKRVERFLSRR